MPTSIFVAKVFLTLAAAAVVLPTVPVFFSFAAALAVIACAPRPFTFVTTIVPALELAASESMLCRGLDATASSETGAAAASRFTLVGACLLPGLDDGAGFSFVAVTEEGPCAESLAREAAVLRIVDEGFVGDMGRAPSGFNGETGYFVGDGTGRGRGLTDLGDRIVEVVGLCEAFGTGIDAGGATRARFFGFRAAGAVAFSRSASASSSNTEL